MGSPFHAVAHGLRLTNIGFLLACWGAASAFGMYWFIDRVISYPYREMRWVYITIFIAAILAGVAGVVVGFIGRIRCLKVPTEFPAVRGRAIVAVVLESSGWGSLFVGVGVAIAMGFRLLPDAPWVPGIGMILSGVMLLSGRIMFLRFLRVLGQVVEDRVSTRRARHSLALFLADWAVGVIGVGTSAGGSMLSMHELTTPLAFLLWIAAGASGLAGLILYDRLLSGLARSVQALADAQLVDEDDCEPEADEVVDSAS